MSGEEIGKLLETFLPKTPATERAVVNASRIHLAEIAYVTGDYGRSAQWLSKYIVANPLSSRGWLLAAKLTACSIVPKESILRLSGRGTPEAPQHSRKES
jgi:hypothetical protein